MPKQKNPEIEKQNFELRKLFIGGLITLIVGLIGTGIWKIIERDKKEKLLQFMLTTNPQNGNTVKTFNVIIYTNMTGEAIQQKIKYKIENVVFQKGSTLNFQLIGDESQIDLNGYFNKDIGIYTGIVLGNNNIDGYQIESWDTDLKE